VHAGYAIYFPELFPTHLRGTGGGLCFNVGLVPAAPMLFASGPLQKEWGVTRENAAPLRSPAFAPETRATELPE
jgi:hypothetical protein